MKIHLITDNNLLIIILFALISLARSEIKKTKKNKHLVDRLQYKDIITSIKKKLEKKTFTFSIIYLKRKLCFQYGELDIIQDPIFIEGLGNCP